MTIQFNLKDDRSETVHYDFVEYPVRAQRALLYGTFIVISTVIFKDGIPGETIQFYPGIFLCCSI